MADREIKEAKSLRWLAVQFPKVENPKDDVDKMQNCINLYCTNAADLINFQQAEIERLNSQVNRLKRYDKKRDVALHSRLTETARAEAIREFADKLKDVFITIDGTFECWEVEEHINNLVKETAGES